jgi:AcrR family transcriptional regulator
MARRSDHSREELREMALGAAREIVEEQGVAGLSTRALAARMGYAPGTLYNIFHNLDDLVFALNTRTVGELRSRMEHSVADAVAPPERIQRMAQGYLDYALAHPHLWRLAFQHQAPEGQEVPEETTQQTNAVFAAVASLLGQLGPAGEEVLMTRAAALWAGVHGVCHLAVTDKLKFADSATPAQILRTNVDCFLAGLNAGEPLEQVSDVL